MWHETDNQLHQQFEFADFVQAFTFMTAVAGVAEQMQHHPKWLNEYNKVEFWLCSHDAGNVVTEKDRQLAAAIDEAYQKVVQYGGGEGQNNIEQAPHNQQTPAELTDQEKSGATSTQGLPTEVKLFGDGGSRGNPGPSAGGFVILDMDDTLLFESGKYLGITTNNQAEYHSLKGGLEKCLEQNVRIVHVFMDSMLVVNQMKGTFKVRNRDLWPIHQAILDMLPRFEKVEFTHVPRELNKLADGMVNKTLDAEAGAGAGTGAGTAAGPGPH